MSVETEAPMVVEESETKLHRGRRAKESLVDPSYPSVKQFVRTIAGTVTGEEGVSKSIYMIDAELAAYVDAGYKLISAQCVGQIPQGYIMVYVLARQ